MQVRKTRQTRLGSLSVMNTMPIIFSEWFNWDALSSSSDYFEMAYSNSIPERWKINHSMSIGSHNTKDGKSSKRTVQATSTTANGTQPRYMSPMVTSGGVMVFK